MRRLPPRLRGLLRRARRLVRRGSAPSAPRPAAPAAPIELPPRPELRDAPVRLLVGPANFAGQGWEWGRAAEREFPEVAAQVFALERPEGYAFRTDYSVTLPVYRSPVWGRDQERYVVEHFTHVLIEAGRPVLGGLYRAGCEQEAAVFAEAGLAVAMVAHGSDVRLPSRHVQSYPWSPFKDPEWDLVPRLEEQALRLGRIIGEHQGPRFVSTPDLLDDVPGAVWLPTVVDVDRWTCATVPLERERPLVVHAPSNTRFKGTELIEPIVERLAARGLIDYRRISGVPNAQMPALFADADVVLDQFVLGIYSVAACEGLAAGRVVVAHVADHVRAHVGEPVPVVEATVETLEEVLERICAERDWARATATQGQQFVRRVHDGRRSAQALGPFLGQARDE